jgi:hypothetical protein
MAYQIAEQFIIREDKECFIGDLMEFFTGYALIGLFYQLFRLVGCRWWVCMV